MASLVDFQVLKGLMKHLEKKRRHMASEHRHQTDAKSGQNHLAVPNSVFDDASQSAVLLLILCLVSVQLMSELFWTF